MQKLYQTDYADLKQIIKKNQYENCHKKCKCLLQHWNLYRNFHTDIIM